MACRGCAKRKLKLQRAYYDRQFHRDKLSLAEYREKISKLYNHAKALGVDLDA